MFKKIKRFTKLLHLWLSLPAGIIITIISLTGALLVYQDDLEQIIYPERYRNSPSAAAKVDWKSWFETAQKGLPDDTVTAISFSSDPDETVLLKRSSAAKAYAAANRNSGVIQTQYNTRKEFFYTIKKLHRWLTDESRATGRWIVGCSSIFMVIILCTGWVAWLPQKSKNLINRLRLDYRRGVLKLLIDLHRVLGAYAMALLLLLALTGPVWSFAWYYKAAATLFRIETQGEEPKEDLGETLLHNSTDWARALYTVEKQIPDASRYEIRKDGKVSVLKPQSVHELATDEYRYDPAHESLTLASEYGVVRDDRYFMGWVDVLHTGNWGGHIVRFLTFLAGIIGTSLPVTGYLLYFRKRKRVQKFN